MLLLAILRKLNIDRLQVICYNEKDLILKNHKNPNKSLNFINLILGLFVLSQ
nr:MAG TPA: hypothetical protein [Caudoviricetes sp.]